MVLTLLADHLVLHTFAPFKQKPGSCLVADHLEMENMHFPHLQVGALPAITVNTCPIYRVYNWSSAQISFAMLDETCYRQRVVILIGREWSPTMAMLP